MSAVKIPRLFSVRKEIFANVEKALRIRFDPFGRLGARDVNGNGRQAQAQSPIGEPFGGLDRIEHEDTVSVGPAVRTIPSVVFEPRTGPHCGPYEIRVIAKPFARSTGSMAP
jgi:hypothetical protein